MKIGSLLYVFVNIDATATTSGLTLGINLTLPNSFTTTLSNGTTVPGAYVSGSASQNITGSGINVFSSTQVNIFVVFAGSISGGSIHYQIGFCINV
jgi:hypothetical protein